MKFPTLRGLCLLGRIDLAQGNSDGGKLGKKRATGQHLVDVLLQDFDTHNARIEIDVFGKTWAIEVETQVYPALQADRTRIDHGREMPEEYEVEALDCLSLIHCEIFTRALRYSNSQ